MAGRHTPFQRRLIANDGEIEVLDILREIGTRIGSIHSYPPILPQAGQAILDVLNEIDGVANVRRSDESDSTESSDS
jgi:hypothetical protein